jgi:toxin ParE1/3/4
MSRFTLARGVRADLRGIWRHIAIENHSPDAADRLIDRITDVFALLAREPLLGEARDDLAPGIRAFVVGSYLAIYRPAKNGVQVTQVVPAARDIAAVFRRPGTAKR